MNQLACDVLNVLFQIPFVQQRPVPCTGLHCTPPRKARKIKDPRVLCPLYRALCLCVSVFCCVSLCLCVLCLCVLCAALVLLTGPLCTPPRKAQEAEKHLFSIFSCMSAMCYCSFSSINSSQSMLGGPACSRSKSSCSGCNSTPRFKPITPSTYIRYEIKYLNQRP